MTALETPAAIAEPQARLDLGRVIGRTFGAISGNFVTFFLLAILFAAIPSFLMELGLNYFRLSILRDASDAAIGPIAIATGLGISFLSMIPTYVLIGALTQGSIVYYNNGKASFGECLSAGLSFLLPLIGLGIATVIGFVLWMLLVIVPGAFLAGFLAVGFAQAGTMLAGGILGMVLGVVAFIPTIMALIRWSVAAPSLVVERTGVMGAFRRSLDLTRRNRWAIFFLAMIWIVISYLIQLAITFIGASTLMGIDGSFATGGLLLSGITILYSALNTMILATGQAALYYELRVTKEGATSDELVKIFE